jgi:hypothetical protein
MERIVMGEPGKKGVTGTRFQPTQLTTLFFETRLLADSFNNQKARYSFGDIAASNRDFS